MKDVHDTELNEFNAFGNRLFLKFSKSTEEEDITWRFYTHYIPLCFDVLNVNNIDLRRTLIKHLYRYFYNDRFKKRIEGSKQMNKYIISNALSQNNVGVYPQINYFVNNNLLVLQALSFLAKIE